MGTKTSNNAILSKETSNKLWVVPLIIIIILGAILRCFRLSFQSYWYDEVITIKVALSNYFFKYLAYGSNGDPPLYEFLFHFWIKIFGHSEISTRGLSVIFSVTTLPAMYLLTKELFNNKTAFYSTLLLSFSAYHIYYAQEARMYALTGFLTVSSSIFFIKALKNDKRINWILYSILTVLAFYAHYSALFVVLAQNIIVCFYWREYKIKLRHWIGSLSAIVIMLLPWTLISLIPKFIIPTFIKKNLYLWIPLPSYKSILQTFVFFNGGHEWIINKLENCYLLIYEIAVIIIVLMILTSLWPTFKQKESSKKRATIIFTILWCLLPIIIAFLISILVKPIYTVSYVNVALFAFLILIAQVLTKTKPVFLNFIVLSFYLIPNIITLNYYYRFPIKPAIREIVHFIQLNQGLNDKILIYNALEIPVFEYYYYNSGISRHATIIRLTPPIFRKVISEKHDFWLLENMDNNQLIKNLRRLGSFDNIYQQQAEMKQIGALKVIKYKKRTLLYDNKN